MIEDHRARERDLAFRTDSSEIKERKMKSLLNQAADMILQAMRADVGNDTPEKMPQRQLSDMNDDRLPQPTLLS